MTFAPTTPVMHSRCCEKRTVELTDKRTTDGSSLGPHRSSIGIHGALQIPEIKKALTDLLNAAKQALMELFRKRYVASGNGTDALMNVSNFAITTRS